VLRHARGLGGRKPEVIVVSPWWIRRTPSAPRTRALGYLVRPISLRDSRAALEAGAHPAAGLQARTERRPLAKVWLLDQHERGWTVLSWDLYDVSTTGAFIETRGPLPVGAELLLEIIFGKESVRCTAWVVRVQEPCWMHVGGVGVVFIEIDPVSRRVLDDFVHQSVVIAD
jgi:hypothetical protein